MTLDSRPYSTSELAQLDELRSRVNVAKSIASARIDRGLTQDELGRMAGTKQSRISEVESMGGNPRFDTLDRISRALGLMVMLVPRIAMVASNGSFSEPKRVLDGFRTSAHISSGSYTDSRFGEPRKVEVYG